MPLRYSAYCRPMTPRPIGRWRLFAVRVGSVGWNVTSMTQSSARTATRIVSRSLGWSISPAGVRCWSMTTEPRLHTAVSSWPVFSVISVHRFDECTTPAWSCGLRTLHGSLNVIHGWPVSKSMRSICFHSSIAGIRSPCSSPASTRRSYSS